MRDQHVPQYLSLVFLGCFWVAVYEGWCRMKVVQEQVRRPPSELL